MSPLPPLREMERAVRRRDASYDGIFFVGVRTTGIFCRPSCCARTPLPRNREYFTTASEAIAAGYRPCKRCRPLLTNGRSPLWVERLLSTAPTERLRDHDLAARGIHPARARRYFRKHFGMTFQAYCRRKRMGTALQQIRQGKTIDAVVAGNGYDSHSGFREAFQRTFGQPPGKSRSADCIVIDWTESPLGPLLIAATAQGVCLLEFTGERRLQQQLAELQRWFSTAIVPGRNAFIDQLHRELTEYFAGKRRDFEVPLVYPGTPFQVKVWDQLRRIPYAETLSYEALAAAVGSPQAQRAVGLANGKNRIAIVIPCHRVINKSGRMGGYGGGLWRKEFLLNLERERGRAGR